MQEVHFERSGSKKSPRSHHIEVLMPVNFYVLNDQDLMLWRPLRQPTIRAQALEKPPDVTDSQTADLRNAPEQKGVTPAV